MTEGTHHPTAIISPEARIGADVRIGPFAIIEDDVVIGDGTEIRSSAVIGNGARVGRGCKVFSAAAISTEPQDLKYEGEATEAILGDNTVVRECATVNRGTKASGKTIVGSGCLIMAYSHVAHDCRLGDGVIMANATQLAGHVHIGDSTILGGGTLVHQFSRIGKNVMIGAGTFINKDVPPFMLVAGSPAKVGGLNSIGLRRHGFNAAEITELKEFYHLLFRSGHNISDALRAATEAETLSDTIAYCIEFIRASQRGIYTN